MKSSTGVKLKTTTAGSVSQVSSVILSILWFDVYGNVWFTQANPLLKPEVAKQLVNTTAASKLSTTTVTSASAKPKPTVNQVSGLCDASFHALQLQKLLWESKIQINWL